MWWEQVEKRRRERKAREGFKVSILSILFLGSVYNRIYTQELRLWDVKARCKWKDVYLSSRMTSATV